MSSIHQKQLSLLWRQLATFNERAKFGNNHSNYSRRANKLTRQPIRTTTRFSGSDVTGQYYRPVPSDVSLPRLSERRRRLKFRLLQKGCIVTQPTLANPLLFMGVSPKRHDTEITQNLHITLYLQVKKLECYLIDVYHKSLGSSCTRARQGKINYEICIVILIHRNEKEQSNNNNKKNTNNQNPHKRNQVSSLFLRVQIHVHSCEQKIYHYIAIIITFTLTYKNILKTFQVYNLSLASY